MVKIFAHRGASCSQPENTLPAFDEAVRIGADVIELDVQLTRDRRLAVFHDESLDRMTGLTGRVIDRKLATIQEVDIGARCTPQTTGIHVPSLCQVLQSIPDTVPLNIHAIAYSYSRETLADRLVRTLAQMEAWDRCLISSDVHTLKEIRLRQPEATICSLTRFPKATTYLRSSVELGCQAVQPLRQMLRGAPQFIDDAHRARLEVNVVYANTEEEMRELIEMGADGIFTDDPGLLRKVLQDS